MKTMKAPMGWNSWDCYGAAVTEDTVRKNAEYMAENLKQYGWEYIVVDIQWSEPTADGHQYHDFAELCMDEYSRLIPAENRFPSSVGGKGFAPLAEYVHSLGLKFGIHIMRGIPRQAVHQNTPIKGTGRTARQIVKQSSICQWNTDMYGIDPDKEGAREYYDSLFELYASWGVDFIKCDDIANRLETEESELVMLSQALENCGRPMVFSISPGPAPIERAEFLKQYANMWRITDDFWDNWTQLYDMFFRTEKWCIHTGPGNWPDADMLPIGPICQIENQNNQCHFSQDEQITMLTLWCIFRSPLMIGGEMTGFDDFTRSLVTNEDVLKMHRNARHAHPVWRRQINGVEHILWVAVDSCGGQYLAVFNTGDADSSLSLCLEDVEIDRPVSYRELWSGEEGTAEGTLPVALHRHGAKAFKLNFV